MRASPRTSGHPGRRTTKASVPNEPEFAASTSRPLKTAVSSTSGLLPNFMEMSVASWRTAVIIVLGIISSTPYLPSDFSNLRFFCFQFLILRSRSLVHSPQHHRHLHSSTKRLFLAPSPRRERILFTLQPPTEKQKPLPQHNNIINTVENRLPTIRYISTNSPKGEQ